MLQMVDADVDAAAADHCCAPRHDQRGRNDADKLRQKGDTGAEQTAVTRYAADLVVPARARADIPPGKFPVTAWAEISKDIDRVGAYVASGQAQQAVAVLIDEDGRYDLAAAQSFSAGIDLGKAGASGSAATGWINRVT